MRAAGLAAAEPDLSDGDPFGSFQWPELRKEFLEASARTQFDARVRLQRPAFAEDPLNVPITVSTDLPGVQRLMVPVDRNPIRKVLELQPLSALPAVSGLAMLVCCEGHARRVLPLLANRRYARAG